MSGKRAKRIRKFVRGMVEIGAVPVSQFRWAYKQAKKAHKAGPQKGIQILQEARHG